MNNIKAVILDLDGTLLDDNKKISNTTIEFLKQIKEDIKIIASINHSCFFNFKWNGFYETGEHKYCKSGTKS